MMAFMSDSQNNPQSESKDGGHTVAAFTIENIEKLSALSRLALTPEEKSQFSKDIGGILSYVSQIQEVAGDTGLLDARLETGHYVHKNQMRDDIATTGTGSELNPDTSILVDEAPEHTDGYVQVKKIL
ncbi:MAG: Asp-tRNA(Asn)/Glu-tRNA(Gln) amidotransferase subunit GatC [Candidatus Parcubacteria bacterium]